MIFCEDESIKLDYVNGQLSPEARHAFERHLTACEDCRNEAASMRVVASAVRRIPRPRPTRELVEQTQMRLAKTAEHWAHNHLLWNAFSARSICVVPSILASILIALALTALFTVFHDYIAAALQKTFELSVVQLLWGTGSDNSGSPLSIPIIALSFILALLLIPSLFENAWSLRFRLSSAGRPAKR